MSKPTINPYEQRLAVQSTIRNYISQLMLNNDLSPSMVEDALNKVIIDLHPMIVQEILEDGERIKEFRTAQDGVNEAMEKLQQEQESFLNSQEVEDGTGVNTDNN